MEISLFTFVLYVMHVQTRFSFVLNSNSFLTLSALRAFMAEQKRKTLTFHDKVQVIKHKKKTQEYSKLVKLRSKQFWKMDMGY